MNTKLASLYRKQDIDDVLAKHALEQPLTAAEADVLELAQRFPIPANHDEANVIFAASPDNPINPILVSELIDILLIAMPEGQSPNANQIAEIIGRELVKPERQGPVIFNRSELSQLYSSDIWQLWCAKAEAEGEQDMTTTRCNSLRETWPDIPVSMSRLEAKTWVYQKLGGVA